MAEKQNIIEKIQLFRRICMGLKEKKDFVFQLICNGTYSFESLKEKTKYSYDELMLALKELVLEKKIIRRGMGLTFVPMEKVMKEQKELNELMTQTCCIARRK